MRGYHSDFKKGLTAGLRPDYVMVYNTGLLAEALNCRLRPSGLEGYNPQITTLPEILDSVTLVPITITYNWPFPQLFLTDSGFYMCTGDGIWRIYGGAGHLLGQQITAAFASTSKWPWSIADCPKFPVFCNGDYLVYYDYDSTAWITYSHALLTAPGTKWDVSIDTPLTCCYFRGQILFGGTNDSDISNDINRQVSWTDIGRFDTLDMYALASPVSTADLLRNIAGYTYFSSSLEERVLRLAPIGKYVIAYGEFSIRSLTPVQDPAPTYSPDEIADFGIACPLAVGVGNNEHIFICRNGYLWKVTVSGSGPTVTKIGYIEFFSPLQAGVNLYTQSGLISILYNNTEKEYYISNGSTAYIYNQNGLTEGSRVVYGWADYNNIMSFDEGLIELETTTDDLLTEADEPLEIEAWSIAMANSIVGLYQDIAAKTTYMQMKTDILDFDLPTIKTIESVDLAINTPSAAVIEVMVEWRDAVNAAWNTTTWKRCNPAGQAYPLVSGVQLRVCVRISNFYNTQFDTTILTNIGVGWKISDRSGVRGLKQTGGASASIAGSGSG